jgi:tetraacyldisaccharide 4'-kinase
VAAVRAAAGQGADVAVLDDAFQHRRIARDLDIVLIPAETPTRQLLPAGPLREPVTALRRADVLVITRKTQSLHDAQRLAAQLRAAADRPVIIAHIALRDAAQRFTPVVMVAGVARPDLFLQQATAQGIDIVKMIAYPDHHDYSQTDADYIAAVAAGRPVLTTGKDAVKLATYFDPATLWTAEQQVLIEEGREVLFSLLEKAIWRG